ncbi:MAG: hypothetical protein EZS28_014649 [Streblomastix strix]|uniref:Uncharacterized protein n=1 Tax=Streblomastix strix TaxID=222440 RepID=A0A5J4W4A2_9EUKA|nr:MAG: hypothetical protein EZS28_014649 [Streblomastix strix]
MPTNWENKGDDGFEQIEKTSEKKKDIRDGGGMNIVLLLSLKFSFLIPVSSSFLNKQVFPIQFQRILRVLKPAMHKLERNVIYLM